MSMVVPPITKEPEEDVVLCKFCGNSLHDPEHDIDWTMTVNHDCVPLLRQKLEEKNAAIYKLRVALDVVMCQTLDYSPLTGNSTPTAASEICRKALEASEDV